MTPTQRVVAFCFLIAAAIGLCFCSSPHEESDYRLVKVFDGDTIQLRTPAGEVIKVRYIGIDCPEMGEPYYRFALKTNRKLLKGNKIILEFDEKLHDDYGRTLAYVYADELMVNAELLRLGCARLYFDRANKKYLSLFLQMEGEARRHRRGLWEK